MLQPRFGVVPYVGREDLLRDLEAWCTDDRPFTIGVIAGDGGAGKSRLGAELCARMQRSGWMAGPVPRTGTALDTEPDAPTLLVVDYPEEHLAGHGFAIEQLACRVGGPPVRLLLLSRRPAARSHWWADLDRSSHGAAGLFTTLERDLTEHGLSRSERQQHAEAAVRAFGRQLGMETGDAPDVTDDEFASPLLVHMAALLHVLDQRRSPDLSRSSREDVLAHVLARERARWRRLQPHHQLADLHDTHALRAVLVAVLAGPSAEEAPELLGTLPEFSGAAQRERRGRIGYWLAELYQGEPLLASFGPDLVVEELLDSAARGSAGVDEVIAAVHGFGATRSGCRSRMVTTLRLAAERRPAVRALLHTYLASTLPELVEQALDEQDGLLATAVDGALAFCSEHGDPKLKLAFASGQVEMTAPEYHERGANLLCTVMRCALPLFRGLADLGVEDGRRHLGVALALLSHRLQQCGRHEEALETTQECVQVHQQIVAGQPTGSVELGWELANLAAMYSQLGRHAEALAAAGEAVAIHRDLLARGEVPDAGARLAVALHRLCGAQGELGRYDEALESNTESLSALRERADADDSYYGPLFAEALSLRSAILAAQHRYAESLAVGADAVKRHRSLVGDLPDRHLTSLSFDLHAVSLANAGLGQYDDASAAAEEAAKIGRRLTAVNPRRHRTTLLKSLDQLIDTYLRLGRLDDAVRVGEEAVELSRQGSGPEQALALSRLADLFSRLGRHAEALSVCVQAAALLHRLTASDPRLVADHASTLTDLSQIHGVLGHLEEALTEARHAVDVAGRLDPSEHPILARALVNLGDQHARSGHDREALEHTAAGVHLFRSADHRSPLVPALAKLADRQARFDDHDNATALALEAVRLGEALHNSDPTADVPDFVFALRTLSSIHLWCGRPAAALDPIRRAVLLSERLTAADPDRHLPALAALMHSQASIQLATGQLSAAIETCEHGNRLYEQLTRTNEGAYLGQLAGSLAMLRAYLMRAGRPEEALPVAQRHVDAARRLTAQEPGFAQLMIDSYLALATVLAIVGDALAARQAVALAEMHQTIRDQEC